MHAMKSAFKELTKLPHILRFDCALKMGLSSTAADSNLWYVVHTFVLYLHDYEINRREHWTLKVIVIIKQLQPAIIDSKV